MRTGICRECGLEAEFPYPNEGRACRPCVNKLAARRMRLVHQRRRNGETLPFGEPCACCGEPMQRPCLDHDHHTGTTREFLCMPCNVCLGIARDDVSHCLRFASKNHAKAGLWLNAAGYLRRHERQDLQNEGARDAVALATLHAASETDTESMASIDNSGASFSSTDTRLPFEVGPNSSELAVESLVAAVGEVDEGDATDDLPGLQEAGLRILDEPPPGSEVGDDLEGPTDQGVRPFQIARCLSRGPGTGVLGAGR